MVGADLEVPGGMQVSEGQMCRFTIAVDSADEAERISRAFHRFLARENVQEGQGASIQVEYVDGREWCAIELWSNAALFAFDRFLEGEAEGGRKQRPSRVSHAPRHRGNVRLMGTAH